MFENVQNTLKMFEVEVKKTCRGNIYSFENSVEVKISIQNYFVT